MTDLHLTPTDLHPWVAAGDTQTRFGVSIFPQPPDWHHFIDLVQQIEQFGFDAYYAYDHPESNTDCWTSLAALAATTSTIRLGTLVACIYYRSPYMLARQAADVDRLSGGRLILGLGIGHVESEFRQMGIPYPPTKERLQGMVETITILRGLWSGEPFAYDGKQWQVDATQPFLPPVQSPRVPILLAGGGEQTTLKQVARYADASNMGSHPSIGNAVTDAEIRRKLGVLDGYLAEVGRSPDSVVKSHFTMPLILAPTEQALAAKMTWLEEHYGADKIDWCGEALVATTPEGAIAFYNHLRTLGFTYFIANVFGVDEETIEILGRDVLPAFA